MASLSERLKEAMIQKKLSHKQAANLAGVSDKTIQRILNGADPTPKTLGRILEVLNGLPPIQEPSRARVLAGPANTATRASIAVIPFDTFGGDERMTHVADGLVEELITSLAQFSELNVIARNSSFSFRNQPTDIAVIARALNVRYVVEGSVRGDLDKFRIVVQLIDSTTGAHIWAERFDKIGPDILKLQDEVTAEIVPRIFPNLLRHEIVRVQRSIPKTLEGWDIALRAWIGYIDAMTPASAQIGVDMLEPVLASDPAYAFGHAVVAVLSSEIGSVPVTSAAIKARTAADVHAAEALRLAERDPLVLLGCGHVHVRFGRIDDAIQVLDRATQLCPNHAYIRCYRGLAFLLSGRIQEGLSELELAETLSPLDIILHRILAFRAAALFEQDHDAQAFLAIDRSLHLRPNYYLSLAVYAGMCAATGRMEDAVTAAKRVTLESSLPFQLVAAGLLATFKDKTLLQRIGQGWAILQPQL